MGTRWKHVGSGAETKREQKTTGKKMKNTSKTNRTEGKLNEEESKLMKKCSNYYRFVRSISEQNSVNPDDFGISC